MTNSNMQKQLLSCFKELKKVLDKNDIKFTLDGGSIIGAVREKGFLPWDDDMDIIICEEDIDKFIKVIGDEKDMSLTNYKNVTLSSFFKVYFKNHFVMNGKHKSNLKIDVFVLYKQREFSWWSNLMRVMTIGYLDFKSYEPTRYISKLFPFTKRWLQKRVRDIILKGEVVSEEIGYLYDDINFWNADKNTQFYYKKYEQVEFEKIEVMIPYKARETMMTRYGDIMVPPKKGEEETHGTKLV